MRLIGFFLSLFLAIPAFAGESSLSNVLGFSEDGKYFAFEEYGVRDGLGAPYSSIFALDVEGDKWLPGSPVRLFPTEAEMPPESGNDNTIARDRMMLGQLRGRALQQAQSFLTPIAPLGFGVQRAHNLPWELDTDAKTVRFTAQDYVPANGKGWRLELEEFDFPGGEKCYSMVEAMKGFRLRLIDEVTGVTRILNEDVKIPKSRPCPLGYRIEKVITYQAPDMPTVFAILIRYQTIGFEGQDGRLLAITGRF